MSYELDVLSDLSEVIRYNLQDYPIYSNIGNLGYFYKHAVACHWHPDIEITLLLDGDMDYFVNGETIQVKEGQCIFINTKRLHYNYSAEEKNCRYLVVTINPTFFSTWSHPIQEYIQNKFGPESADYLILNGNENWHKQLFDFMFKVNDELHNGDCNLLNTTSYALSICGEIAEHISPEKTNQESDPSWLAAWQMTGFIHKNYGEKITLSDIAAAGGVCRSTCCLLFNKYINQTPNSYLINYRIQKSLDLLRSTTCSISEIAMRTGFQSASYFTQTFREQIGIAPRKYRETNHPSFSNKT